MRRKLVIGNWKMNYTLAESTACVDTFVKEASRHDSVDVGIAPSFISLSAVAGLLRKSHVMAGAQDAFWAEKGAFTGEVSVPMIKDAGAAFCIIGHSEPRGRFGKLEVPESTLPYFHETDETVNLKLKSLLYHSVLPIVCVGETEAERSAGDTKSVVSRQIDGAFAGLDPEELLGIVVAYEPVWAIGTGKVCEANEAGKVIGEIRKFISDSCSAEAAAKIRILYGGSIKASNAKDLFSNPEIDGGLVGGASLDPREFAKIVSAAA